MNAGSAPTTPERLHGQTALKLSRARHVFQTRRQSRRISNAFGRTVGFELTIEREQETLRFTGENAAKIRKHLESPCVARALRCAVGVPSQQEENERGWKRTIDAIGLYLQTRYAVEQIDMGGTSDRVSRS